MCTIVILNRPGHDWPILIAANRDERHDRPWKPPAAHWPERPEIIGGLDELAGGSWLAINAHGVVAAALNREGTLGPKDGKRSRGELVLDALDHVDATDAARALAGLDPLAYRPFNLVIADNRDAYLVVHRDTDGKRPISAETLPEGLTLITSMERDDPRSARIRFYRPKFEAAAQPDPAAGNWADWESLLASREREPGGGLAGAMYIDGLIPDDPKRFGTVSSCLMALPGVEHPELKPIWRFASGAPEDWVWTEVLPSRN
jgi:hypothetical protein